MILDGRKDGGRRARSSCSTLVGLERPRDPSARPARRAASSSGSRSPWPWPTTPTSSSPTSRPASSTARRRATCSACCGGSIASWARRSSIVTHDAFVSEQVQRTVAIRDGRTSTETLRRTEQTEDGDHRVIAEEFAVLDRAGRLQLPRAHVDALDLHNRVRLRLEEDHVGVWPDKAAAVPAGRATEAAAATEALRPRLRCRPQTRRGRPDDRAAVPAAGRRRRRRPDGRGPRAGPRLPVGRRRRARPARDRPGGRPRRAARGPRPLGERQDDAPQPPRRARPCRRAGSVIVDGTSISDARRGRARPASAGGRSRSCSRRSA